MLSAKDQPDNWQASDDLGQDGLVEHSDTASKAHDEYAPSLIEDVQALYEDGTAYVEAELAYQKTRIAFTASKSGKVALYGVSVFGVLLLALIALVVGSLIALIPSVGAWGATGIVVGTLLIVVAILGFLMRKAMTSLGAAFSDNATNGTAV